jgi:FkbM family methyltransferase
MVVAIRYDTEKRADQFVGLQARINHFDKLIQAAQSLRLAGALIRHRVLGGAEHRHVLTPELATVLDLGANRGQFSLAVREWAPEAQVISFEPLPRPAQVFRSVFAEDAQVVLHEVAIGPRLERRAMHVSARDDSSSLLPISALQSKIFPRTSEVATLEVRVAQLETFVKAAEIRAPAMLKLDVQGFEYEALTGCESLLHCFDRIYCECSFIELYTGQKLAADVIDWLWARGFRMSGIFNVAHDERGTPVQADFLFRSKDSNQEGRSS